MRSMADILRAFEVQAGHSENLASPITARVCRALAVILDETTQTGRIVLGWKGDPVTDALPLRLCGALHALVRAGVTPELDPVYHGILAKPELVGRAIGRALAEHDAVIAEWLDSPPQTNEIGRGSLIAAGLLDLTRNHGIDRIEILEIGASAGLNLLFDRYRFDLGGVTLGPSGSPVLVQPEWRGAVPSGGSLNVVSARGVDIAPLDVGHDAQARRLLAYVWPDQHERLPRLEAAIEIAREHPPKVERGDAADWLEGALESPQDRGVARVLVHTVVWQYVPSVGQRRIEALMAQAGVKAATDRPVIWLAFEWHSSFKNYALP